MLCFLTFSELFASTCGKKITPNLHSISLTAKSKPTQTESVEEGKKEEIRTGKDNRVVVKDVFLSGNEAQEDRVNIHHPSF